MEYCYFSGWVQRVWRLPDSGWEGSRSRPAAARLSAEPRVFIDRMMKMRLEVRNVFTACPAAAGRALPRQGPITPL